MTFRRSLLAVSCLVATAALLAGAATERAPAADVPRGVLADVRYEGGLCVSGSVCSTRVLVHQDGRVRSTARGPRRLSAAQTARLRRAIAVIDMRDVRAHPFTGTCPIAYDGTEAVYRFRGPTPALRSCRYDLRRVEAVRLLERFLAG